MSGVPKRRTAIQYVDAIEFGGSERVALTIAAGIAAAPGWRSVIAYHRASGLAPLATEAHALGIEAVSLPAHGLQRLRGLASYALELRSTPPSVFHAHLPNPLAARGGLLAAEVADPPAVVATAHLHVPLRRFWQRARARRSRVDHYIAVSEFIREGLRSWGVESDSISVVHNGVRDIEAYPSRKSGVQRDSRGPTIVTVARLVSQKGHSVLLRALVALPGVSVLFAGDGPLRADLERLARELGVADRTRFLGDVADVPALLARADVFALTSFNEGSPLAILEAMAAGLPIVASRVGGTPEIVVDGETGLLVPPHDPASTANAIRRLVDDADLRERLGRRGQLVARDRFTAERMIDDVIGVYEELLARDGGGRSRVARWRG
jgi:glycosyltransferase involved in cell wall biosynthesis